MTLHKTIVAAWMKMEVLSSKNPECVTLLPLMQDARAFCEFFHSPAGSVRWQEEAIGDVQ